MEKMFDDLRKFDWVEKKQQEINYRHKAGFVHNDMPITNPVSINISQETMSKLKRLSK